MTARLLPCCYPHATRLLPVCLLHGDCPYITRLLPVYCPAAARLLPPVAFCAVFVEIFNKILGKQEKFVSL